MSDIVQSLQEDIGPHTYSTEVDAKEAVLDVLESTLEYPEDVIHILSDMVGCDEFNDVDLIELAELARQIITQNILEQMGLDE